MFVITLHINWLHISTDNIINLLLKCSSGKASITNLSLVAMEHFQCAAASIQKNGTSVNIADLAEFLLSAQSSWITGKIFHVGIGMSALKV